MFDLSSLVVQRLVPDRTAVFKKRPERREIGVFFVLETVNLLPFAPLHSTSDTIIAHEDFLSNG